MPGSAPTNSEVEGKGAEVKDGTSSKKHKGTAGSGGNKAGEGVKVTSGSGNDSGPQRFLSFSRSSVYILKIHDQFLHNFLL